MAATLAGNCRAWKTVQLGSSVVRTWALSRPVTIAFSNRPRSFSSTIDTRINPGSDFEPYRQPELKAWVTEFTTGKKLSIVKLDNRVFGQSPRLDIIHRVVVWQLAKKRAGTASTKTRGEVRGGGKKPWPQKGSGRARHGSNRSPLWKGGGVSHGPRPRSYDYTLPKKVRALGLKSALSTKYTQGDLYIVDSLEPLSCSTKDFHEILKIHGWNSSLLVEGGEVSDNLGLSSRNIPICDVLPSVGLNVYSILLRDTLVLSLGALRMLERRLSE